MTTPFAARDAKLSGSIDKGFGEQFTFTATAAAANGDVNLPKIVDGTKPLLTVVGVWEAIADKNYPVARGSNPDDEATRLAMQYPSVSVNKVLLTWLPQQGTLCTRLFDGSKYEVAKALHDDMGRVLIFLSKKAKP